jgi:hypothetical protein
VDAKVQTSLPAPHAPCLIAAVSKFGGGLEQQDQEIFSAEIHSSSNFTPSSTSTLEDSVSIYVLESYLGLAPAIIIKIV